MEFRVIFMVLGSARKCSTGARRVLEGCSKVLEGARRCSKVLEECSKPVLGQNPTISVLTSEFGRGGLERPKSPNSCDLSTDVVSVD